MFFEKIKATKSVVCLLVLCLYSSSSLSSTGDVAPPDIKDGVVNFADVVRVQRYILGNGELTQEEFSAADVAGYSGPDSGVLNGDINKNITTYTTIPDGKVDIADLIILQRIVLGSAGDIDFGQDSDADGLLDSFEWRFSGSLGGLHKDSDSDSDGLTNLQEQAIFGNPYSGDSDKDGISDRTAWENRDVIPGGGEWASQDDDGDGVINGVELNFGLDPGRGADDDGDGIPDAVEIANMMQPNDADDANDDRDGDGLSNILEYQNGSNISERDSDGDGLTDGFEYMYGFALDSTFTGGSAVHDAERDSDNDNMTNIVEQRFGTNPIKEDTDDDGLNDDVEVYAKDTVGRLGKYSSALYEDTDNDGVNDDVDNCPDWFNTTQNPADCMCGDVDLDGTVSTSDVDTLNALTDFSTLTTEALLKCDVNDDGYCTLDDANLLSSYLQNPGSVAINQYCPGMSRQFARVLERIGYGAKPAQLQRFPVYSSSAPEPPVEGMAQQVRDYLSEQVSPNLQNDPIFLSESLPYRWESGFSGDPNTQLDPKSFPTMGRSDSDIYYDYQRRQRDSNSRPTYNAREIKLLRSLYSDWPLNSMLLDFWWNHFSVNQREEGAGFIIAVTHEDIIAEHMWGQFEDLLLGITRSPTMLEYLDLQHSRVGNSNQNFGREVLELHSVGPEAYEESQVSVSSAILTGNRYTQSNDFVPPKLFVQTFDDTRHDTSYKQFEFFDLLEDGSTAPVDQWHFAATAAEAPIQSTVCPEIPADPLLGVEFRASTEATVGENETIVFYCKLVRSRRAADFVVSKLLLRLLGDGYDMQIKNAAVNTWVASHGNIRAVVNSIIQHEGFVRSLYLDADRSKRPLQFVATLFRMIGNNSEGDNNSFPVRSDISYRVFANNLKTMGESLYQAGPPTGYSEYSDDWNSPAGTFSRLKYAKDIVDQNMALESFRRELSTGLESNALNAEVVDTLVENIFPVGGFPLDNRQLIIDYLDQLETLGGSYADARERAKLAASALFSTSRFMTH